MDGHAIANVPVPVAAGDAANKEYVDSKHKVFLGTLTAAGWTGDKAPYIQTVAVAGVLETDCPHVAPVFPADAEAAAAVQEAARCISFAVSETDGIRFTCLQAKPGTDISFTVEVNR